MTNPFPILRWSILTIAGSLLYSHCLARPPTEPEIQAEYQYELLWASKVPDLLVSQIVTDDESAAQQAILRINAGETFEDVAKQVSKDLGSRSKGGDLGWGAASRYFPEIETALNLMKVGDVSARPIHSKLGWHVLKLRESRVHVADTYESRHRDLADALQKKFSQIDSLKPVWHPQPQEYLVSQIYVKSQLESDEAKRQLDLGVPFDSVARAMSADRIYAAKGGDLGWKTEQGFSPQLGKHVASLAKGQISPQAVQTEYGWHIFWVRDIRTHKDNSTADSLNGLFFEAPAGPPVIQHLIDAGADANAVHQDFSVLAINCQAGSAEAVTLLLKSGANLNLEQAPKVSALDGCIIGSDSTQLPAQMLSAGARLDLRDGRGFYPLSAAVLQNRQLLAELFLRWHADIEQHNLDGSTALSLAASQDQPQMVQTLLDLGANPLTPIGKTPQPTDILDTALSAAYFYSAKHDNISQTLPLLRRVSVQQAVAKSQRHVTVYIEQNGKRHLVDGKPIHLKRAPFGLEIGVKGGKDVMVQASASAETADWIRANPNTSEFGNDAVATHLDDKNMQMLVVADRSNFLFHHWIALNDNAQTRKNPNDEIKARRQIKSLHFEDQAHAGAANRDIDVAQATQPLFLTFGVGEKIGRPYYAIVQTVTAQIIWD